MEKKEGKKRKEVRGQIKWSISECTLNLLAKNCSPLPYITNDQIDTWMYSSLDIAYNIDIANYELI